MLNIYKYSNYRDFVKDWVESHPNKGRGLYSRMAEHIGVQKIQISHVMNKKTNFTVDQALLVAQFMKLDINAAKLEYFLYLILIERANSKELEFYLKSKIKSLGDNKYSLVAHLPNLKELDLERMVTLFSDVHLVIMFHAVEMHNSMLDLKNSIKQLGVAEEKIDWGINKLCELELIYKHKNYLKVSEQKIHIDKDSPVYQTFLDCVSSLNNSKLIQLDPLNDYNYNSILTLSVEDASEFNDELLKLTRKFVKKIKDSPAEQMRVLSVNFRRIL